jgi:hypothetical protein
MSSLADQYVVNDVLTESDKEIFFKQKRWNYVVDSSSTGGVFPQQIQFNLNTVGAIGNFVSLKDSYVQMPYRVRITNTGSGSQTPASAGVLSTAFKNGFWHTIDSAQLVLDNETINMNQKYTNIPAHFQALTTWNEDALSELGATLGLYTLDDFPAVGATAGFNNVGISTLIPDAKGVNLSTASNTSIPLRQYEQNVDCSTSTTALNHIAGATNARLSGKSAVQAGGATATAVNNDCYVQFVLITVRLRDICPAVEKLPPIQNLKGMLYINHNSARNTFTTSSTSTISAWNYSTISGSSMPVQLLNVATTGFQPASGAPNTWTLEASVSGVPSPNLTNAQPPINYGRLVFSYYEPNPDVQSTMAITKSIRYNERFNNYFNIAPQSSFSGTITPGLPNVKGLLLVPYYTGVGNSGSTILVNYDPLTSPFECAPASTSVLPILKNLQVIYGNQPVFTQPVNMSYELFLNEIAQLGLDGGQNNMSVSGVLNEKTWSNLYRYHYIDLSRRVISDENQSKSIQVSVENGTIFPMNVLAFVFYEKEFTIDCATGKVSRG